jgi:hypothetical protein
MSAVLQSANLKGGDHLGYLRVGGDNSKMDLKEYGMRIWTVFIDYAKTAIYVFQKKRNFCHIK